MESSLVKTSLTEQKDSQIINLEKVLPNKFGITRLILNKKGLKSNSQNCATIWDAINSMQYDDITAQINTASITQLECIMAKIGTNLSKKSDGAKEKIVKALTTSIGYTNPISEISPEYEIMSDTTRFKELHPGRTLRTDILKKEAIKGQQKNEAPTLTEEKIKLAAITITPMKLRPGDVAYQGSTNYKMISILSKDEQKALGIRYKKSPKPCYVITEETQDALNKYIWDHK